MEGSQANRAGFPLSRLQRWLLLIGSPWRVRSPRMVWGTALALATLLLLQLPALPHWRVAP